MSRQGLCRSEWSDRRRGMLSAPPADSASVTFVTGEGLGQEPERAIESLILIDAIDRPGGDPARPSGGTAVEGGKSALNQILLQPIECLPERRSNIRGPVRPQKLLGGDWRGDVALVIAKPKDARGFGL